MKMVKRSAPIAAHASGSAKTETVRIAWFRDGKPGHENQALGLLEALQARCDCQWQAHDVRQGGVGRFLRQQGPFHLAVAAGHATHGALCRARFSGVTTILLMRPSLPFWLARYCFDRMIIPRHDQPPAHTQVLATEGALNRMHPQAPQANTGMILLGGPSSHVIWEDTPQLERVQALLQADPARQWVLADSRRTPEATRKGLQALAGQRGAQYQPWEHCPPGWLMQTLPRQARIWVSADSVSMVYEALSTNAEVGLLPVAWKKNNRLAAGLKTLLEQEWLLSFDQWRQGMGFPSRPVLQEADRAAEWLLQSLPEVVRACE